MPALRNPPMKVRKTYSDAESRKRVSTPGTSSQAPPAPPATPSQIELKTNIERTEFTKLHPLVAIEAEVMKKFNSDLVSAFMRAVDRYVDNHLYQQLCDVSGAPHYLSLADFNFFKQRVSNDPRPVSWNKAFLVLWELRKCARDRQGPFAPREVRSIQGNPPVTQTNDTEALKN